MFSYRARPRHVMPDSDCAILGISVGQEYHEGDKFGAALEFACHRFSRVVVAVSDASQRYGMAVGGTPLDQAEKFALAAGSAWLARHSDILDQFNPEITRWNDWRAKESFAQLEAEYRKGIAETLELTLAVNADIDRFLSKKQPAVPEVEARKLCEDFLVEELAVHTLQAKAYGGARLYPGQQLRTKEIIRETVGLPVPEGLNRQRFQSIRLVRRNSFITPQAA